jgi:hypothetical protein
VLPDVLFLLSTAFNIVKAPGFPDASERLVVNGLPFAAEDRVDAVKQHNLEHAGVCTGECVGTYINEKTCFSLGLCLIQVDESWSP